MPTASTSAFGYQVYGTPTPFVGRRAELEALYEALRCATNEKSARILPVHGPPGVGKSRLVDEFVALINEQNTGVRVYRSAYSDSQLETGFAPLTHIVRQRFGIAPEDSDVESRDKLVAGLANLVDGERLHAAAHLLGALLQLPFAFEFGEVERGDLRRFMPRAYQTAFNLLRMDAANGPVIVVFDNWNAAPPSVLEWITDMGEALADSPVLVLLLSRDPISLPAWNENGDAPSPIALGPLDDDEMTQIVTRFLGGEGASQSVVNACVAGAEGLPRHLEDVLRLLVQRAVIQPTADGWAVHEARLAQRPLPVSTAGIARERVLNLDARERAVLEAAAALGSPFWVSGVVSILHAHQDPDGTGTLWEDAIEARVRDSLSLLVDMEAIRRHAGAALHGEEAYAFINPLERDELLGLLSDNHRVSLHRLAAQWMTRAQPHEPSNWNVAIAEQFERTGSGIGAARHLVAAADHARDAFNNACAVALYERALVQLDVDQAGLKGDACFHLAWVHLMMGHYDKAEQHYKTSHAMARILRDREREATAINYIGRIHLAEGQHESARKHFDRALALFEATENLAGIAAVREDIGKLVWHEGKRGAYEEAQRYFQQSLHLRQELGDDRNVARCLSDIANMEMLKGDTESAEERHHIALEIRRRIGDQRGEAITLNGLAALHYEAGDSAKAIEVWATARELAVAVGDRTLFAAVRANMGEAHMRLEQFDDAHDALVDAREAARELKHVRVLCHVLRDQAELLLETGGLAEAQSSCLQALDLGEEAGNRHLIAICLCTRARIATKQAREKSANGGPDQESMSRLSDAEEDLSRAVGILDEMGDMYELQRALYAKASLFELTGRSDESSALRDRAERVRSAP